jgi:hypothetical protein
MEQEETLTFNSEMTLQRRQRTAGEIVGKLASPNIGQEV